MPQPDHGRLLGLGDDDHPQYAKASDVAALDHGADLAGLADDDHTQYYNAARHTKAVHDALALDHGSLGGLADDDHTQYVRKDVFGAAGRILVSTGNGAVDERVIKADYESADESTTSTSFTDLTTTGPNVTCETGTMALVHLHAAMWNTTAGEFALMGFAVSGDSTVAATDAMCIYHESGAANDAAQFGSLFLVTGLTAGDNTFTVKYRASAGTAHFYRRRLIVIPL